MGRLSRGPLAVLIPIIATAMAVGIGISIGTTFIQVHNAFNEDATLIIHQGEDMGRPSRIELAVRKRAGSVERVVVRGACVPVMRGALTL